MSAKKAVEPGDTVHVGDQPATVEEVGANGTVRARLGNGMEVVGTVETEDKSWPPRSMENKAGRP